jgi:hypothetical protein
MPDLKADPTTSQTAPAGDETAAALTRGRKRDAADPTTSQAASKLEPGAVIEEDDEYETVVVRRKKAARPTGRHVTNGNYVVAIHDKALRVKLKAEGAFVNDGEGSDKPHVVTLPPGKAFTLPQEVADHGIGLGVLAPEVK